MNVTHAISIDGNQNAPACWMTDIFWVVLVDGENSGGGYSVVEQWMRQGASLPLHAHAGTDEWFNVIEGELEVQMLGERIMVKAGDSVWIPRQTPHGFTVTSQMCKVLNGYTPGGLRQLAMDTQGMAQPLTEARRDPPMPPGADLPPRPTIPHHRR